MKLLRFALQAIRRAWLPTLFLLGLAGSPGCGGASPSANDRVPRDASVPPELSIVLGSQTGPRLSQVYAVAADGGSIRQVTTEGGATPDWCPDGSVVYGNGPHISRWDERGALPLTSTVGTDIIPDCGPGDWVLFSRQSTPTNPRLWIMKNDGTEASPLGLERAASMASWSPDGTWIVYSAGQGPEANDVSGQPWEIWQADIRRGEGGWRLENHRRVAPGRRVSGCGGSRDFWFEYKMPVASPDGQRIVMWGGVEHSGGCDDAEGDAALPRQVWTVRPDGTDLRCIPSSNADGCEGGDGPEWSPDGEVLLPACTDFLPLCPQRAGRVPGVSFCLAAIGLDGSNRRCLFEWPGTAPAGRASWRR